MNEVIDKTKYNDKNYSIPYNRKLSKDSKEYFLAWMEAIYSYWIQGKTGITYQSAERFRFLRKYGEGKQSEDIYKNLLMGEPRTAVEPTTSEIETDVDTGGAMSKNTKRRGYMNLLWDIISPADKLQGALLGKLSQHNTEISVDAVDETSRQEVERRKFDLLRYMNNKDFEDQYRWMAGIPPENPEYMPDTKEQLDLYAEEGGFKLPMAIAMETFANVTEEISSWDEIRDDLYADMIDIKVSGMYPEFDEGAKRIVFKYADPEMVVIQYSRYNDHRDSEYGGLFDFVPVSELIQRGVVTEEDEIKALLEKYSGKYHNPVYSEFRDNAGGYARSQDSLTDSFKVLVFKGYWIDNDIKKDLVHTNKYGKPRVREYTDGMKINSKERLRETTIRKLYTCQWVVGTEYCYDYGINNDIVRKNQNDVNFPLFIYKAKGRSLTEQIIPLYDSLQLNWLKYQDAVATAKKAGYVIDYNAIANLKLGGSKNPEKEIIRRLMQTGIIVVKATNLGGRPNTFQKPVYELSGGIGKQLEEFITSFEFNTRMIESFTGINPITLGSPPANDALVGTTEISVAGTDNILQGMTNAVTRIQQKIHDYSIDWLQLLLKYNPEIRKSYEALIGRESMSAILAAIKDNVAYGTFITPGINDFEKKKLLDSAEISLQNGREGKPGITEADYAYILRMLKSKASTKKIYLILDQKIKEAQKSAQQAAQQAAVADREAQAKNDQEKFEREHQLEQEKHQWGLELITAKGEEERKTLVLQAEVTPNPVATPSE